ncbi:MAG: hypothetical protein EHM86_02715 [Desulfobulbaceae bacterium]|nr:MAG: hypothetical protein EHM86_02715 [Desulfobulbaceae bacterium]
MATRPIITLTTDFGLDDEYVGAVKGVLLSLLPDVQLVDITHSIAPQDIRKAAIIIGRACSFFPDTTIHLAVVDPGVGSARPILAIKTTRGYFVGPDNGIFTAILQSESTIKIHHVTNSELFLSPISRTFHGRDIMAPVAARLAAGMNICKVGPPVASNACYMLTACSPQIAGHHLTGEIISRDRFGNLRTNISEKDIKAFAGNRDISLKIGSKKTRGICSTYAEASAGELITVVDSFGSIEIAVICGNAADELHAAVGDKVSITFSEDQGKQGLKNNNTP